MKYIHNNGYLEPVPRVEKPEWKGYVHGSEYTNTFLENLYKDKAAAYNAWLSARIPTAPNTVWEDREYEEGRDFELKEGRTYCYSEKWGYGCSECCNGDRCDGDCDATYSRSNCPFCKGTGWIKEKAFLAYPLPVVEEKEIGDLQAQVKEHVRTYSHMDWREALTEQELDLLYDLLMTFKYKPINPTQP